MNSIPTFDNICDLFENEANAWEKARPFIGLALMLAPGALFGSFGTFAGTLAALDSGLTLNGAVELLETVLPFKRKTPVFESPYDLPRLANTMVVFAAWFRTLEQKAPQLWAGLELDEAGWCWIKDECQAEYEQVKTLSGGDGHNILPGNTRAAEGLTALYRLLMEKTRKIAGGLAATEHLAVDWESLPAPAVKEYFRCCEMLEKYDSYYKWVHKQESAPFQAPEKPKEPSKLHLRPISSLHSSGLFQGRKQELDNIHAAFTRKRIVVLTGLGGIGKTELAVAYAKDRSCAANLYFLSYQESFENTMATGVLNGIPEYSNQNLPPEQAYQIAWNRLLQCSRDDLLILDNVDVSTEALNPILKRLEKLPMRCLVTTRYDSPGSIPVGTLQEDELLEIFNDFNAPASLDEQRRLIRAVEYHTLTVSLMAQTLRGGWVKAQALLDALSQQSFEDVFLPEIDAYYPGAEEQKKIYGHLRTVFQVTNMDEASRKVLTWAVLLPAAGLNADAFQTALDKETRSYLIPLAENGWLTRQDDKLFIHPVIRLVCKNELSLTDETCSPFLERLQEQFNSKRYNKILYGQLAELFSKASETLMDSHGYWSNTAGIFWRELGQYQKALESHENALSILEKVLPKGHPDLALVYSNVGSSHGLLGNHRKALKFKEDALNIWKKVLRKDHPDLAASYNNVGITWGDLGNHKKALEFKQKAHTIWTKVLSKDDPTLALSYNNVGGTYGDLGNHPKALEMKQKALVIFEKVLPEDHPRLADSYNNVGITYDHLGNQPEALNFLQKALTIREKVLPDDHPDLATSYNNVGTIYGGLGDHLKALTMKQKALAILEKVLPENHPNIAAAYNNITLSLCALERFSEALPYIRKAIAIAEKSLPEEHPALANYRKTLKTVESCIKLQEAGLPFPNPFK